MTCSAWHGRMVDKMRELRPVVETGYENIILTRLLIEEVSRCILVFCYWCASFSSCPFVQKTPSLYQSPMADYSCKVRVVQPRTRENG